MSVVELRSRTVDPKVAEHPAAEAQVAAFRGAMRHLAGAVAVITTGTGEPCSIFCVAALKALQNSMMLRPRCPSAGPIGGDGFACPAGTCNLM